jgi:hypothetical protein
MRHHAVLFTTMIALGVGSACSDPEGSGTQGVGGTAGMGGAGGTSGAAGMSGGTGTSGSSGMGGSAGTGGAGGASNGGAGGNPVQPTPALPDDAPTVTCPTEINGSLETSDGSQTGRHSRFGALSACGMTKMFPGNGADPTNPHLFDVYRFSNPTAAPVCFTFTLTYGEISVVDVDAGADAAGSENDAGVDTGAADAGDPPVVVTALQKYLTAYGTFFPTDLSLQYLGDTGDRLVPPQEMGVTVPANGTIDVVVYAIDVAPAGVDSYTLSCSTQ